MKKQLFFIVFYALFIVLLPLGMTAFGSEKEDIAQCVKKAGLAQAANSGIGLSVESSTYECIFSGKCWGLGMSVGKSLLNYFPIKAQCTKEVQARNWYKFWR